MLPTFPRFSSFARSVPFLLAALVVLLPQANAQSVQVTVPDTTAVRGDTVSVPVSVSGLDQVSDVTAYGFELRFPDDSLAYAGVDTTNTLTGQAGFTVDDNPDVPRIGAFGSTPLSDGGAQGVLLRLRIAVTAEGTAQVALDSLQFNDGSPAADPAQPTFLVTGTTPNFPPAAVDDSYETTEDQSLQISSVANGVLGNDSDPNGDSLSAGVGATVSHGSLSFNSDGTFEYTPNTGFTGDDTFRYAASDPGGATDSATVTISVEPPNTPPSITTIADQTISEDSTTGPLSFTVDDPETAPESLSVRATSSTPALVPDDSVALQGSGADRTLTVTPVSNASGTTTITLTVSDGADSTQQDVQVTVQSVNDAPVGSDDQYRVAAGDTLRVTDARRGVLDNDNDVDDSSLFATLADSSSGGTVALDSAGTFTYAPSTGFTGSDAFTYAVGDGRGGRDTAAVDLTVVSTDSVSVQVAADTVAPGDTATVPVTLQGLDQAAGITAFSFTVQFNDSTLAYSGVTTDSTLAGQAGFTVEDNPDLGRIAGFGATPLDSVAADGTLLRLQFVATAEGTTTIALDSLTFNTGLPPAQPATPTATITADAPVRPPRASQDQYETVENTPIDIDQPSRGVLANDAYADRDSLTASLLAGPANGSLTFQSDGTFTYRPDSAFTGTDAFRYRVSDPSGRTDSTDVEISVAVDSSAHVRIDDVVGGLGDTVTVPIRLRRLNQAAPITAYGFDLSFDSSRVSYAGFSTDSTLSKQAGFTVDDNPDIPRIGAFGSTSLNAEGDQGVMLRLKFVVDASGETSVTLNDLQFNEGKPKPSPETPSFTVTGPIASDSVTVDADGRVSFAGVGLDIAFSGVGTSGTVVAQKFDVPPPGDTASIAVKNVSSYHYRVETDESFSYDSATLYFDVSTLRGVEDPGNVSIYRRDSTNASFVSLSTTYDSNTNELSATATALGTVVFGSNTEPLPVELTSLTARLDKSAVELTWRTVSETNNAEFQVQRRVGEKGRGSSWTTVGTVGGAGTSSKAQSYRFTDGSLPYEAEVLTYRLKSVDTGGRAAYSRTVSVQRGIESVQLLGTYPNPARQQATVRYALPKPQHVTVQLYDVLGRVVKTIVRGRQKGRRKQHLDVSALPSGVYFLRLKTEETVKTQRLTVVR